MTDYDLSQPGPGTPVLLVEPQARGLQGRDKVGKPFEWMTCSPSSCAPISGKACSSSSTVSLASSPTMGKAGASPCCAPRVLS